MINLSQLRDQLKAIRPIPEEVLRQFTRSAAVIPENARCMLIAAFILALFAVLAINMLAEAPAGHRLQRLEIQPSAEGVVIGHRELAQHAGARSAEREHLLVRFRGGQWQMASVAWQKRVNVMTTTGVDRYLKRWRLKTGDRIQLDGRRLKVVQTSADSIAIKDLDSGRTVHWAQGTLIPGENEFLFTDGVPHKRRLARHWRWILRNRNAEKEQLLFTIGGQVNCPDRWKLDALPPRAVGVRWQQHAFWLSPENETVAVGLARTGSPQSLSFEELAMPLESAEGRIDLLVIGRTYYRVTATAAQLTLVPIANIDFWPQGRSLPKVPDRMVKATYVPVKWIGEGASLQQWLGERTAWLLSILLFAGVFAAWYKGWRPWRAGGPRPAALKGKWRWLVVMVSVAAFGTSLLTVAKGGRLETQAYLFLILLSWAGASVILTLQGKLTGAAGHIWLCALLLVCFGTLALTQLAAGAGNTRWLPYAHKNAQVLAATAWLVCLLSAISPENLRSWWKALITGEKRRWRLTRALAVAAVPLILLFQLLTGGEAGTGDFQPAEMAKTLLALMAGPACMHIREALLRDSQYYRQNRLRATLEHSIWGLAALFLAIALLVSVRDYSPTVILFGMLIFLFWYAGQHPWRPSRIPGLGKVRIAVLLVLLVVLLAGAAVKRFPDHMPIDHIPQKERLLVWAQPERHPHTGEQYRRAAEMVGQGGWWGAGASWFGPNGKGNSLPAVQDDFILAFFIYKFGAMVGLCLALVQLVYARAAFDAGRQAAQYAREPGKRDLPTRTAFEALGISIFCLSWIVIVQWAITWGNTLGLLPVMGQPMTWISAGRSHLLAVGLPALLLPLVAVWATSE